MIMCVLLCYPVSIRIYYQQGGLFLVYFIPLDFHWVEGEKCAVEVEAQNPLPIPLDVNDIVSGHFL